MPIYVDLGAGVHVQHFVNAFEGDVDGLVTVDIVATGEAWPRPLGKKRAGRNWTTPRTCLRRGSCDMRSTCGDLRSARSRTTRGRGSLWGDFKPTVNKGGAKELSPEQQPLELSERHVELP